MDVTPRELRDIEIREGFRGYNRDDVDELLERAAATIESLNERLRKLSEQVQTTDAGQQPARETEDMLHRTLLLAQKAADEAVAEAQFKARQILDEAETKSRAQLAEAESSARRQVDSERRRLEGEVMELASRREALLADVDGLERFENDYRARLRRALEADLETLAGKAPVAPTARPAMHEVDVPSSSQGEGAASTPSLPSAPTASAPPLSTPTASPQPPSSASPASTPTASPAPPSTSPDPGPPTAEIRGLGSWDVPGSDAGTPSSFTSPSASTTGETPRTALFPPDQSGGEPLDDEAFFASLREAVSDQAPLGPRDEKPAADADADAAEDDDEKSGLFRRRR